MSFHMNPHDKDRKDTSQPAAEDFEPVKNPNPAANANIQERTDDTPGSEDEINSEITDGENA